MIYARLSLVFAVMTFAVDARADAFEEAVFALGKWSLILWGVVTVATRLYEKHVELREIRVLVSGLDVTATFTSVEWSTFGKDRQYVAFEVMVEVADGNTFTRRAGLHFRNAMADSFKPEIQVGMTCRARVDPERPEATLVFREAWATDSASR